MRDSKLSVGLIVCGGTDTEWQAIRAVLESFGARVIVYLIGRPNDFINVINGSALYPDIDHLVISAHGEENAFLLPELAEDYYVEHEPRITQFDAHLVGKHGRLTNQLVLTTGCTLGNSTLGQIFLDIGCRQFMGPDDYVEGNAVLFFVIRFYYELMTNHCPEAEAFKIASDTNAETELFRLYKR